MNENLFATKDYENKTRLPAPGKQTQFKPNFKGKKMLLHLTINGRRGVYVQTAGKDRLEKFGAAKPADIENWANRELWLPVYQEEKFVGALGSGDSAVAGFLTTFIWGHTIESALRYANAAGSMNVTVPDGLSWNKGFDDLTRRIESGWKLKELAIDEPGWRYEQQFGWVGPADRKFFI